MSQYDLVGTCRRLEATKPKQNAPVLVCCHMLNAEIFIREDAFIWPDGISLVAWLQAELHVLSGDKCGWTEWLS